MEEKIGTVFMLLLLATVTAAGAADQPAGETDKVAGETDQLAVADHQLPDKDLSSKLQSHISTQDFVLENSTDAGNETNRGFLHGFGESISIILVSEIGDKTFFIAAILAMKNSKLVVFSGATSALFIMTVLSGLLGWVFTTFIPREYTYYSCTAIMFLFGLKMLWEAFRMDEGEAEETQREVQEELANRAAINTSSQINYCTEESRGGGDVNQGFQPDTQTEDALATGETSVEFVEGNRGKVREVREAVSSLGERIETLLHNLNAAVDRLESRVDTKLNRMKKTIVKSIPLPEIMNKSGRNSSPQIEQDTEEGTSRRRCGFFHRMCEEESCFGATCVRIFRLFVNTFTMTFLAEWGDRSQLATIVLVGINDVGGVIVGGCLGHFICTGVAVLCGALIARFISVRKVTFIGALVFLAFAISSIFTSPLEEVQEIDGISVTSHGLRSNQTMEI